MISGFFLYKGMVILLMSWWAAALFRRLLGFFVDLRSDLIWTRKTKNEAWIPGIFCDWIYENAIKREWIDLNTERAKRASAGTPRPLPRQAPQKTNFVWYSHYIHTAHMFYDVLQRSDPQAIEVWTESNLIKYRTSRDSSSMVDRNISISVLISRYLVTSPRIPAAS
jgi:hypothetical protein